MAPRDYLSSFLKIGTVAALGVVVAFLAPQLEMPALTRFIDGTGPIFAGPVFPFCFITIACGAISGFHCLVASGTAPKLLASEADIRLVGYGAMITEMCVGVLALIAACAMPPGEYFAINLRGEPAAVVQRVTEMGFPVTEKQMEDLAAGYQKERNEREAGLKSLVESINALQKEMQDPAISDAKKKEKENQLKAKGEEGDRE